MEKPKIIKAKRKKRRKNSIWQRTLKKELELIEVRLYQEQSHANVLITASNLEKRRNPNPDYVR